MINSGKKNSFKHKNENAAIKKEDLKLRTQIGSQLPPSSKTMAGQDGGTGSRRQKQSIALR